LSVHPPASLWRHHDFTRLWAGQTISLFGSRVGGFALTFVAILTLHASPIQVALLNAARFGPGLVIGLFAGVWLDRRKRRPVMIVADIGRAALLAIIPLAAALGHLTITLLFVIALGISVLTFFFDVAYRSYLPTLVRRDELIEGNSKLQASVSVTEFGGWSIAGLIVQALSAPGAALVDAVSFVVSAASLTMIRAPEPSPPPPPSAEREGPWQEIAQGLRLVRDNPIFRTLAGATAVWDLFRSIIGATITLYATRELGVAPAVQGVIWSIGGISSLCGAVLAERLTRRWGVGRTMCGMLLLAVISSLFIPLASGSLRSIVVALLIHEILLGGPAAIYGINRVSLLQASTPDRLLGRMNASIRFIEWSMILLGLLLGGVLGETIGLRAALFCAFGGQLLAPLWLVLSPVRALRDHPAVETIEATEAIEAIAP